MMFGFLSCGKQKVQAQPDKADDMIEISISNQVAEADIWVIPDTEENRKSSVWGSATLSKADTQGTQSNSVQIPAGTGRYLIRMIDTDGMYYAADDIVLADHQSIVIRKGEEDMSAVVEVCCAEDATVAEYAMFVARL